MLTLNINVDDPRQAGYIPDIYSPATGELPEYFLLDAVETIIVSCKTPNVNQSVPWKEDYDGSDTFSVTVGNPDDKPSGGTFMVNVDGTVTSAIAYNETGTNIGAAVSAASTIETYGNVTVVEITPQVYELTWQQYGAVPAVTVDVTYLRPSCTATVTRLRVGSGSIYAQQIIEIKRSNVASCTPSTSYTGDDLDVAVVTALSESTNLSYSLDWNDSYAGTATLSVVANGVTALVVVSPNMSILELGTALTSHPSIFYANSGTPDTIAITQVGDLKVIEFVGDLSAADRARTISGNSAANPTICTTTTDHGLTSTQSIVVASATGSPTTIAGTRVVTVISPTTFSVPVDCTGGAGTVAAKFYRVADQAITISSVANLIVPLGRSGTISFTDDALKREFFETEDDSIIRTLRVQRTRGTNVKTILAKAVTIKR